MFDEEIIRMNQELRDLRTAHNRGLGMIDFSEKTATVSNVSSSFPWTYTAVATFDSDETFPPIVQFAAVDNSFDQNPLTIGAPVFDSGGRTATVNITNYNYTDGDGGNPIVTLTAVSSIPITNLTITENA